MTTTTSSSRRSSSRSSLVSRLTLFFATSNSITSTTTTTAAAAATAVTQQPPPAQQHQRQHRHQQQQKQHHQPSSSLLSSSSAATSRWLEDAGAAAGQYGGYGDDGNFYAYDLSSFSVRYDKCQYVKTYDDDLAADEDTSSPLALKHLVLFRLCPTDHCESDNRPFEYCGEQYGRYVVDVEDYLQYTVQYQLEQLQELCDNCDDECNDDNIDDCSTNGGCAWTCYQFENLENEGYVDAADYIQCQELQIPQQQDDDANNNNGDDDANNNNRRRARQLEDQQAYNGNDDGNNNNNNNADDDDDEEEAVLYIGPKCTSSGGIEIAIFADENCWEPVDDMNVEEVLGMKMSYHVLWSSLSSSSSSASSFMTNTGNGVCLSCAEQNDDNNNQNNQNDQNDADDVNEMCERLYEVSAKCESQSGISAGFIQTNRDNEQYENQVENEFMSCSFIDSLVWNSYTETGEIDYRSKQDVYERVVTQKQGIALGLLVGVVAAMLAAIHYVNQQIANLPLVGLLQPSQGATLA